METQLDTPKIGPNAWMSYDYNIHSQNPNSLTITAYEQYRDSEDNEWIKTNTSRFQSITFEAPNDLTEIEFLLKGASYESEFPLTDYDDWIDILSFNLDEAPEKIKTFLSELPSYTIEAKDK